MINVIARFSRVNPGDEPDMDLDSRHYPREFYFHQYPDGRIRFHKRGRFHCIDQWFYSFDEVTHILEWLTMSKWYQLDNQRRYYVPEPYDNLLFSDHAENNEKTFKETHSCPF